MILRVTEEVSTSELPTKGARLRWQCTAKQFRPLLYILNQRQSIIMQLVHQRMGIPSERRVTLKIICEEPLSEEINRSWEQLVLVHLRKMLDLESVLWNLSTFGGAFSSMGDYDNTWAVRAGAITRRQLKIARELGNATLEARCYLYMALSDAQLGKINEAKRTTRLIYSYAVLTGNDFLQNVSRGVLFKIKDIVRYLKRRSTLN